MASGRRGATVAGNAARPVGEGRGWKKTGETTGMVVAVVVVDSGKVDGFWVLGFGVEEACRRH